MPLDAVISVWDADSIYKIPAMLHKQGVDNIVCEALGLNPPPADLSMWDNLVEALEHPQHQLTIGMVGKYVDLTESYKSLTEALVHAGIHTRSKINIEYIDSEDIETRGTDQLKHLTPSWCRAASASAAPRARSPPSATPARTACPTWASAWACSWP